MQPLVDIVEYVVPGAIIYHQPRDHYYRIMNKTMMKKDKGWEYGWSYQEVECVMKWYLNQVRIKKFIRELLLSLIQTGIWPISSNLEP